VLVVTCPCALSLATPAALAAATTRLARLGLLVTRPDAIERLARADTVLLDKTGTLTTGESRIEHVQVLAPGFDARQVLAIAAALEHGSAHPLAAAFLPHARPELRAEGLREVPGQGLEATVEGVRWRLGRPAFVQALADGGDRATAARPAEETEELTDAVLLGSAAGPAAAFAIADTLRGDAREAVEQLRALGLEVLIASGDREQAVQAAAAALGIRDARARLTPEEKLAIVRDLQARGRRVLMIGDGINDGPVLAAAQVSCAMAQGSAVAQSAADLMLLNPSLVALARSVVIARRALLIMRQNMRWAFGYNLAGVPLAALGLIAPWVAAIGMSLSSLAVVLNGARLARGRERRAEPAAAPVPQGAA
jgi:P-type Cu2+ transporter